MFNVVLHQPEIPQNTGNIIRLCANTGCTLHLIHPLGFSMQEKRLRRAGLDYHELTAVTEHESFEKFNRNCQPAGIYAFSTKGKTNYSDCQFMKNDYLMFGSETRGLPDEVLQGLPKFRVLRIPMLDKSRSMNLSNTVAVAVYEAWRQAGFGGST